MVSLADSLLLIVRRIEAHRGQLRGFFSASFAMSSVRKRAEFLAETSEQNASLARQKPRRSCQQALPGVSKTAHFRLLSNSFAKALRINVESILSLSCYFSRSNIEWRRVVKRAEKSPSEITRVIRVRRAIYEWNLSLKFQPDYTTLQIAAPLLWNDPDKVRSI